MFGKKKIFWTTKSVGEDDHLFFGKFYVKSRVNSLHNYNVQWENPFITIRSIFSYKCALGDFLFFNFSLFVFYVNIH